MAEEYWGRPVPGFGDTHARLLIVGLAPAAHGANRTGRMFTGGRTGDRFYDTLYRFGYASSPVSRHGDDGLVLKDAYITAAARCAPPGNKPLPQELTNCRPYLVRELELLKNVAVVLALGSVAFDACLSVRPYLGLPTVRPKPRFGHGVVTQLTGFGNIVSSYHPSLQNTNTGRLTAGMFDGVFETVGRLLEFTDAP